VRERYGVDPKQLPDFIALRGDSSDRIPGAAGVGAVGAASLLERYGTLKKMLAAGRFAAQKDKLLLYKSIATMDKSAPLPPLRVGETLVAPGRGRRWLAVGKRAVATTATCVRPSLRLAGDPRRTGHGRLPSCVLYQACLPA
jgi:hypothetical protein